MPNTTMAQAGDPCLYLYVYWSEPEQRFGAWTATGSVDEPDDPVYWDWGPFDDPETVIHQVTSWLEVTLSRFPR